MTQEEFEKEFVNRILHGDWIQVLRTLPGNIYHCVVTSPPFWGQRSYCFGGDGSCYDEKSKATIHKAWERFDDVLQVCVQCGAYRPIFGLEKTPEEHIEKLVEGFREIRRVLRDDGVVFLNYADKYADGSRTSNSTKQGGFKTAAHVPVQRAGKNCGLEDGNLLLLPARIALSLQADGWYVRSKIIWAKAISLAANQCPYCGKSLYHNIELGTDLLGEPLSKTINKKYSGSCMPESVSGMYWQQHRVKIKARPNLTQRYKSQAYENPQSDIDGKCVALWADCPGCPKCQADGGLVLRQGSGRCTSAYEEILMLTKGPGYYWDQEAVREAFVYKDSREFRTPRQDNPNLAGLARCPVGQVQNSGRNLRNVWAVPDDIWSIFCQWYEAQAGYLTDVWAINPKAYKDAHYATYPPKLVETCIKAATSAKGACAKCGKQWARIVKNSERYESALEKGWENGTAVSDSMTNKNRRTLPKGCPRFAERESLGWKPTCKCNAGEAVPALVLDPFFGSGTSGMGAAKLGRNWTGIEINPEYIYDQAQWRVVEGETGMRKQEAVLQKALFE